MAPSDTTTVGLVEPRAREIALSAGTIEYEDTGGEGPVIVLLPGLLMDASLWDDVIADLARDHRCIVPTLPLGAHRHGMHADADLSPRGLARLVAELLDRLDLDDVTLVGNDTGGALVQLLAGDAAAARRPDRAGLLRRVRQLPARPDRQDAGADRQAPAGAVRAVHAADAPAAAPAAPARVRLADEARRRRHRPLDQAGPPAARDPPRHGAGAPRDRGRPRPHARRRRVPAAASTAPPSSSGRARTASCRPSTAAASPSSSRTAGWSRYPTATRSSRSTSQSAWPR